MAGDPQEHSWRYYFVTDSETVPFAYSRVNYLTDDSSRFLTVSATIPSRFAMYVMQQQTRLPS